MPRCMNNLNRNHPSQQPQFHARIVNKDSDIPVQIQ